jgi:large subunit ribosomal protein L6
MIIMKADIDMNVEIPRGIEVLKKGALVSVKGPKGLIEKRFVSKKITLAPEAKQVSLSVKNATKREKKLIYTFKAHLTHMIVGALEGHDYKLKICSGHFPMTASLKGDKFEVKNFLGEAYPRTLKIKQGVTVKIDGEFIEVNSPNKELAGQTAADIEQLTRITNRDRRIFQDGIYIISKSKSRPVPTEEEDN